MGITAVIEIGVGHFAGHRTIPEKQNYLATITK
jgi:hypothetical protein